MNVRIVGFGVSCALLGVFLVLPAVPPKRPVSQQPTFEKDVRPIVDKYCTSCHGGNDATAGLALDKFKTTAQMLAAQDVWQQVLQNVQSGHMPPKDMPQPSAAVRKKLIAAIEGLLASSCKLPDPGRVTLRRLNRAEYDNTIRDLVGVDFHPAADFPSDDVGYGFDNIGDTLSLSPLLMEKYLAAAEQIAEKAIVVSGSPIQIAGTEMADGKASTNAEDGKELYSEATITAEPSLIRSGPYRIRIEAYGDQAGDEPPKMQLKVDGKPIQTFEVRAVRGKPETYEAPFNGVPGKNRIGIAFLNDFYDPKRPAGQQDRNLIVRSVEIEGPFDEASLPASHRRIIPERPEPGHEREAAQKILRNFASRAFRRPVTSAELDRLMSLFDLSQKAKEPFERGIQLGVEACLVSPEFLFRVETDPHPHDPKVRPLDDYDVASRLSYFLWSSMPDDRLFSLAAQHKLQNPAALKSEVTRMLADPKSQALADNFAEQWLQLRKLQAFSPNPAQFPQWNDSLRQSMTEETKKFFLAVMDEDRSVLDFINGKFTFVNAPLAKLYGLPGDFGNDFKRVSLVGTPRGGVITQASVLCVTSNPTRTSPVKRGKWILDEILGTPPPPPPPGVSVFSDEKKILDAKTLRKRMEQHRAKPECAACHQKMDPLGFGMENFDAIGHWRTTDGGSPIDNSGTLPDGRTFHGPDQLKQILLKNKTQFVRALTERLMTYGLGRGVDAADRCSVDAIVKQVEESDFRFSSLVTGIVESDPFLKRRGDQ